ncbi:MAG: hypothetical protein RJA10_4102, partial [Pseudomonadota bacterium]
EGYRVAVEAGAVLPSARACPA